MNDTNYANLEDMEMIIMVQRREMFDAVNNAVDNNADLVITLKSECGNKLPIPVGQSDKIAMNILAFLDREYGDLTVGQMEDAMHAAMWWLTTTSVL